MSVDSDLTTLAAVLAAGAAAAIILALLGIRFNQVKVAGTEFAVRNGDGRPGSRRAGRRRRAQPGRSCAYAWDPADVPVRIDVRQGLGKPLHAVP